MHRRLFLVAALSTGLGACSLVGNLQQGLDFTLVNERLLVSGLITSRSPAAFAQVLDAHPQITTIVLQDMEGAIDGDAVLPIGYDIRARGLATALQSDSVVHSGAVDLFVAGVARSMVRGAEIGVHSWADGFGEGRDLPRDAAGHDAYRAYFTQMLGSDAFYWFTLDVAPNDTLYIMNDAEIERFGLLTEPIRDFEE